MNLADISKLGVANPFKPRYDNYIGGEWVAPTQGRYFENPTPITGKTFCEIARSDESDSEKALDAAHAASGDPAPRTGRGGRFRTDVPRLPQRVRGRPRYRTERRRADHLQGV